MATQEELSALFARNLSLQPQAIYVAPVEAPPAPTPVEEPYTYSISRHYHHSAHIAQQPPPRPASEPPQSNQVTVEIVLSRNGVDPSALYPSQIDLFRTADEAQQLRLIELWRICPPDYTSNVAKNLLGLSDSTTSVQQEEALAQLRYERMATEEKQQVERMMLEERMSRTGGDQQGMDSDTMSDASTNQPLTPIQGGDGRWNQSHVAAEPYMQSGYETLAQREYEQSVGPKYSQATDPVYNTIEDVHRYPNVGGDWQQLLEQKKQAMENQYVQLPLEKHIWLAS